MNRRSRILRSFIVLPGLVGLACQVRSQELPPPVKAGQSIRLACYPAKPSPYPLRPAPDPGSSCGLPTPECGASRHLLMHIDDQGQVTEARILGIRHSPELANCLLAEVRANGWTFEPARDCNGDPMPGEYTSDVAPECGLGPQNLPG